MITNTASLIEKLERLENLLSEYSALTGGLSAADLEAVEQTDELLAGRERIIAQVKLLTPEIAEIIDSQPPEKAAMLRKMLNGEAVMANFTEQEKIIQTKIITLRSLQSDILKSDDSNRMRFKRKYDEVREELENLQKEKKKLNFYHSVKSDDKGAEFENQG
jgi:hypothetical protein